MSSKGLLSHEENPATIQHRVTENLNEGLPLAMMLVDPSCIHGSASKDQLFMEMSNLGVHPKDCFIRRLITQTMYQGDVDTISVVVWMDVEGCFHLCGAASSLCMTRERMTRLMDEFVHEIVDLGVV